ncbi:aspartate kinase [Roseivirga sp. BDSF3-8]|uniref:aspartate kinase n=1 Tax=Roseivirga sp. BDSF3-8 TaxID=3241598 RepID=UPI003531C2A3
MKVMKFGGTSVGSPERMKSVAKLITESPENKIVVLSAVSGTTNALVEITAAHKSGVDANALINNLKEQYDKFCIELLQTEPYRNEAARIIGEHFGRIQAIQTGPFSGTAEKEILAQGELISTRLFDLLLKETGIAAKWIPALSFMRLDEEGEPRIGYLNEELTKIIRNNLENQIFLTQGFICRNHEGEIDNLKRGGSDYTASLIGAAINATEVQIWTDIDGMHNNDPRIVDRTFPIAELSFDEAAELAYFGAKILHPSSILPAQKYNIPVRLLNTMAPEAHGTKIYARKKDGGSQIKAIAAKDGITAIKIKSSRMLLAYGFLRKVFEIFERYKTPIDMITTSEVALSVTVDDNTHVKAIEQELNYYGAVNVDHDLSIVCIVGDCVAEAHGVASQVIQALDDIPLRMISYGGSKNNISLLIETSYKNRALQCLNEQLFTFPEK